MTPHFNASFRISDFPQKSFQASLSTAQPARMRRGHTAPRLRACPSLGFLPVAGRHLPLRCLCCLPSAAINVLGALASRFPAPRGKGPEQGAPGNTPRATTVLSWQGHSELCQLPDIRRPHCPVDSPPSRPAGAQAPLPGPGLRAGARRDFRPWPLRETQALVAAWCFWISHQNVHFLAFWRIQFHTHTEPVSGGECIQNVWIYTSGL